MKFKSKLRIQRKLLFIGLVLLFLPASYVTTVGAERLSSLGRSDFPARVKAIGFSSGGVINSSSGQCWGKWCVYFKDQLPIATLVDHPAAAGFGFLVEPLMCSNRVIGQSDCKMFGKLAGRPCTVIVGKDWSFSIECPSSLDLE